MDEYIKKNTLYEKIAQLEEFSRDRYLKTPKDSPRRPRYMAELVERTYLKHIIADCPAEDVEPVKRGRWGMGRHNEVTGDYEEQCSHCRGWSKEYWKSYCPNCGAKMDERNE